MKRSGVLGLVLAGAVLNVNAVTIGFDGVSEGQNVTSVSYGTGTMSISNVTGGIGQTWVYDTTLTGANGRDTSNTGAWDPDLSGPFTMAGGTDVVNPGNVLVIQESNNRPGSDDNGRGGSYKLSFSSAVVLQSINVFDVKLGAVTFDLFDESDTKFATFQNLLNSDTANNETDNLFETVTFGGQTISSLMVSLRDSGAIDDIVFTLPGGLNEVDPEIPSVPLPAAVWLFGTALAGFAGIRFKKRAEV